ncbi:unnamed protein product [Ceutorhynchus assimilis]|uniref:Uncharacterized protein n=1 Tax=Ceutorhynchus assimilis TaxID=467358 RepID=A0A9N9QIH4_9CUCU|nr:unnamed protein product [Ceutorhynchus assimilis]
MASLSSKQLKSSSCSSMESDEIASEQKKIKKGKSRKKIRSTLGLNNFLDLTDDHPVTKSAKKTKTKRGERLDFLPSLEGSSQSAESDSQDAGTSGRNLRRGCSRSSQKTSRNLTKMLSVSEESAVELDKENAEMPRQSKRKSKRKSIKQNAVIETGDIPKKQLDEDKDVLNVTNGKEEKRLNSIIMKNSPRPKRSVLDSPRVAAKLSSTPALFKKPVIGTPAFKNSPKPKRSIVDSPSVNEDQGIAVSDVVRKKSALQRNRSISASSLGKVNEDEVFTEGVSNVLEAKVVNSLKKNSKSKNSPIVDSPMPKQRLISKLSSTSALENLNEDAEEVEIKEKDIIGAMKNTAVDNLRKNSVLRNSPRPNRSVSVVNSPKPKTSFVAKLSKTPAPKNLKKQSTYTPTNKAKRATTSKTKSPEATKQVLNNTFDISTTVLPLAEENVFDFDGFTFDFTEIGDKKPTRRLSSRNSKTSSKSEASVIVISDSSTSSPNKTFENSLNDEVFQNSKKLTTETAMSDDIFYDSICHLTTKSKVDNTTGSDEVFYDSISQPVLTRKFGISQSVDEEITWPSPRKLRNTFDKEEINQENLNTTFDKNDIDDNSIYQQRSNKKKSSSDSTGQSPKKKLRTTFDKSEIDSFVNEITNPSPKKKLKSTFEKTEPTLLDVPVFNYQVIEPTPIKNPKRSTFEKSPTNDQIPSPNKIPLDGNKKNRRSSFGGRFNLPQSEDILEHLNITRRESKKTSFKKRASSFKYSTGSEDEATRRTNFVTLRRCNATAKLNQSTPLFGSKTPTAFEELRNLSSENNDNKTVTVVKSPLPPKSVQKSILKKSTKDFKNDIQAVVNMPAEQLDNFMLDNEKPDFLIDTFASMGKVSLKPEPFSPERRRSSRRRWSQSKKTPILDKLAETSLSSVNRSVRFELQEAQEEVQATKTPKKSVKINSPLTTPKGKHAPMLIKKTPKPKFSADDSVIISKNCVSPVAYMSPPGSTSTPRIQNKSLLQKVLTNEKNKAEKMLKNTSSRVKMPNFAKIHERRNEKLESIQDLVERKAQRAQYLMSGGKSLVAAKEKADKESKKKLFGDEDKEKNVLASRLPVLKVTKMKQKIINKKRASLEKKQKTAKSPAQKTTPQIIKKPVPMEKKNAIAAAGPSGKVISRFGFKMQTDKVNITKEEQIKAVCTKSKFIPNSSRTDQNRKNTVEVRTNRRFELLMKMRANKN